MSQNNKKKVKERKEKESYFKGIITRKFIIIMALLYLGGIFVGFVINLILN